VFLLLLVLMAVGALVIRLPRLDERPMHPDEAVQAARFRDLWWRGGYVYDPNEFHGPTLTYCTVPMAWAAAPEAFADTTEATYRVVPVLFGVGVILLLGLIRDAVGRAAVLCAGLLTALSPAMVFYSRYYIHETLLVFFTLAVIVTGWRYVRSGRLIWCLAAGTCVGLVQATKETSVLAFAAMVIALALTALWNRILPAASSGERVRIRWWHLAAGVAVAVLVAVTFLSSFFTNLRGPIDGVLTYLPWISRAGGESPHIHPWYFYLRMLAYWRFGDGPWWSEGLIMALAGAGFVASLLPAKFNLLPGGSVPFARWAGFYALLLTATYCAIPYKTPWCLLSFLHAMIIVAGVGAVALVRRVPTVPLKALMILVLLAATGHLGWQSHRAAYVLATDAQCPQAHHHPYIYAHTLPDAKRLHEDIEQLALAAREGHKTPIAVVWQDDYYWPLPWYLRRFDRVGYWTDVLDVPMAPIVISSPEHDATLSEKLEDTYFMTGYYGVRPNVLAQLWVQEDLWMAHLRRLGRL